MWHAFKENFQTCLREYPSYHQHPKNELLHVIGMPLIALGLFLPFWNHWIAGIASFLIGATCLGLGHKVEGNKPALTTNLMHIVVAPFWYIKKILNLFSK